MTPWGKVSKIVTDRLKKEIALVSLQKMNGTYTEPDFEATLEVMLRGLLPSLLMTLKRIRLE